MEGQRYRNRHINTNHADFNLIGKGACSGAVLGENGSTVTIGMVGSERSPFFERTHAHDLQHRPEYFFLVGLHFRGHIIDQ